MTRAFTQILACLLLAGACAVLGAPLTSLAAEVVERTDEGALPSLDALKGLGAKRSVFRVAAEDMEGPVAKGPNLERYQTQIQPILNETCVPCHGPEKRKGGFRIDALDPDLFAGSDAEWWSEVLGVIANGDMPPSDEASMADAERTRVIDWVSTELQGAVANRRSGERRSGFRRMTRYEFGYALQDLLGVPWNFARDLAPEAQSEEGFVNGADTLQTGSAQLETMRSAARDALRRVTVFGERPQTLYWGISMADAAAREWPKLAERVEETRERWADDPDRLAAALERLEAEFRRGHNQPYYRDLQSGRTARAAWNYRGARYAFAPQTQPLEIPTTNQEVAIIPPGRDQGLIVELGDRIPDEGIMRVRVHASRDDPGGSRAPWMGLEFGWRASNEGRAVVGLSDQDIEVDARPERPEVYQWDVPLGDIYPRNSVRHTSQMGQMPNPSEYIRLVNHSVSEGAIRVEYVEVIAPFAASWPPASHRRLFFESASEGNESAYAREVIETFLRRAWGSLSPGDLERKVALFERLRPLCDDFESAVIETLATALAAPQFIYHSRDNDQTNIENDLALARKLAAFFWCSIPDETLWRLARQGVLSQPDVLQSEVGRLLRDPRAQRLSKHFVEQWLHLSVLDFLNFEATYREEDPRLKAALRQEPIAFFHELLMNNGSILDCLHADFAMLDERLATHYGAPGVFGNRFRRVSLTHDSARRGGLLTQAAFLTMNSDGEDSHPLKRGIWLLENVLNDPPPPPPPAVPEIDLADPEIAKLSLKEQLEDHRDDPACYSCHAKIDPWGIAFEQFDALGRWREVIGGQPVDAVSPLPNGPVLAGVEGLKRYLLERRQDQFVEALTHKLATYALGRPLTFTDRSQVRQIAAETRRRGDGLETLLRRLVASPLFHAP